MGSKSLKNLSSCVIGLLDKPWHILYGKQFTRLIFFPTFFHGLINAEIIYMLYFNKFQIVCQLCDVCLTHFSTGNKYRAVGCQSLLIWYHCGDLEPQFSFIFNNKNISECL